MGYDNPVSGPMSNNGINVGGGRVAGGSTNASMTDTNLGAAAAAQQAYQAPVSNAGSNAQNSALGYLNTAASGLGPSSAQIMGQQAINQSLSAQLAGAASARGGSLGQAAAIRNAQLGAGAFQANAIQGLAANRAQEMAQAQSAYANASAAQRGQDLQQSGMMSQNEMQQRQLNQQGQMGYQQMAQQSDQNQAQMDLGVAGLNSQNWQSWQNQDQSNAGAAQRQDQQIQWEKEQQAAKMAAAGMGAGASMGAAMMGSDPRMKWDVLPLMEPEGKQLHQSPDGRAYFADVPTMQTRDGRPTLEVVEAAPKRKPSSLGEVAATRAKVSTQKRATDAELMRAADAIGAEQRAGFDARMAQGPAARRLASGAPENGYTTELTSGAEPAYQKWHDKTSAWDSGQDYDLRGAYADGLERDNQPGGGHLPDTYKKPNHETFSNESAYARYAPEVAGSWNDDRYIPKGPPAWLRAEMESSPMVQANRALAPSAYRYQAQYTPPGQAPGEVNVGPMADRMAQSPLSATAVKQGPDGMMMIDHGKGLRLALGGVGSLQQQVDELRAQQGGR